jgi:TRAP-type C4-dicarboxylate transport system permease small subunit
MRRTLNLLYKTSGLLAGFFLVAIGLLSVGQVLGRLTGFAAYSLDEFAGYCMAASSFFGLAWTFRANEHIRMTLLLHHLRGALRRGMSIAALAASCFLVGFFAWWSLDMVWTSYALNDVSQGLVPVRLWIPQSGMALGLLVMEIALLDDLVVALAGDATSFEAAERAKAPETPQFEH